MSEIKTKVLKICEDVKKASAELANLESTTKDQILLEVVKLLKKHTPKIINAVKDVIKLKDPVGKILYDITRENGLRIRRISTPLGVLLAIYESRPNVTSDIAALSLKSGNAVILRCGSDCVHSSKIIADVFREALERFNVDKNSVILVANIEREYVLELLKMENHIDIVIPRGGKSLIKAVMENTKIPVFRHLDGNCHTYIHEKADFNKARKILLNAKMRRVGICGATESLL